MTNQALAEAKSLTGSQEKFALAYASHGNAARAYREAYNVGPNTLPSTVRNRGYELVHMPSVAARVRELQGAAAANVVMNTEVMMQHLYDIGYGADPEEISRVRIIACRRCHGLGRAHQWIDETEWALAAARAHDAGQAVPSFDGGTGYSRLLAPSETCPQCLGAGEPFVIVADTGELHGPARKLFVSARQKANGEVEIETEDRHAARQELHRLLGLITNKSESRSLSIRATVDVADTSPQALLEAYNRSRGVVST
ncbi:MAG TPA: terminase small subunit [Steroidobacteraceae bacterium]|jgi:hypothetical protein|nr:terminase small subunit [Steroidobacteraceae bacterium]